MKKYKLFSIFVAVSIIFSVSACKPAGVAQKIDKGKTQLYVGNYSGGMGSKWLDEYARGFEEYCKNTSFEDGKVGVEVIPDNNKITYSADNIKDGMSKSNINVYFSELVDYYEFVKARFNVD